MRRALWPEHPYGYSILGTRDTVSALSADDLRRLHRRRHTIRGNCVIAAAGNVEHERAARGCSSGKAGSTAARPSRRGRRSCPAPAVQRRRRAASSGIPTQTHIVFGTDTFRIGDPRRFALSILTNVFGGGMSSRLFQRVREELGWPTRSSPTSSSTSGTGQLGVYVGTQPATRRGGAGGDPQEYGGWRSRACRRGGAGRGQAAAQGPADAGAGEPGRADEPAGGLHAAREPYRPLDTMLAEIDAVTAATGRGGGGGVLRSGATDGADAGTGEAVSGDGETGTGP